MLLYSLAGHKNTREHLTQLRVSCWSVLRLDLQRHDDVVCLSRDIALHRKYEGHSNTFYPLYIILHNITLFRVIRPVRSSRKSRQLYSVDEFKGTKRAGEKLNEAFHFLLAPHLSLIALYAP